MNKLKYLIVLFFFGCSVAGAGPIINLLGNGNQGHIKMWNGKFQSWIESEYDFKKGIKKEDWELIVKVINLNDVWGEYINGNYHDNFNYLFKNHAGSLITGVRLRINSPKIEAIFKKYLKKNQSTVEYIEFYNNGEIKLINFKLLLKKRYSKMTPGPPYIIEQKVVVGEKNECVESLVNLIWLTKLPSRLHSIAVKIEREFNVIVAKYYECDKDNITIYIP